MEKAAENQDKELWRDDPNDPCSPSIFVTATGGVGISVGGKVIVQDVRTWFGQASHAFGFAPETFVSRYRA